MTRALGALALAAVVALAACTPSGEGGPPQVGAPMPDWGAPRLDTGDTLRLSALEGRPYVLNLWATWCPPCRHETPYLQDVYERYAPRGLEMVGVTVDNRGALDQARDFLQEAGVSYIQLHDPRMRSMDRFHVMGLPATWVVDARGTVVFARNGPVGPDDPTFEEAVARAVEEASP